MYLDEKLLMLAKNGDKSAKDKLVSSNTGLIHSVVRRFLGRGYEAEDLFQVGCIGFLKAVERFDLHFEVQFSTYAVPMISGEIRRFLRDDGMIKVSRTLKETAAKVYLAREKLRQETNREPTLEEISDATGIRTEDMVEAMEASAGVESIYKVMYQDDHGNVLLLDQLSKESEEEKITDHMILEQALNQLEMREKTLIYLRYYEDKTQSEVAKRFGTSQVQISRMEKKIISKMREYMCS